MKLAHKGVTGAFAAMAILLTALPAPAHEPSPTAAPEAPVASGGTLVYRAQFGPDWIDPGLTWYNFGFVIALATNRPLYSSSPEHPNHPVPDLASGQPTISADRRTVTVSLKPGVHFSPPVNREVTSHDVKYAIERAFSEHVPNGYVFTYFGDLVGAPEDRGPIVDIPGIETPDPYTIVFRLARPSAPSLVGALMMPITVPVPEEYAAPFDAQPESEYDTHVVFTGPYMIKNDAQGNLTGLGDDITIVRNPNWDPATDFRPAHVDKIRFTFNENLDRIVDRTLRGSRTLCCDSSPSELVQRLGPRFSDQIGKSPGHGTRWVALNTEVGPLRNVNVRKAISAAMNRRALRAARGGSSVGRMARHFIPPGVPGFGRSHSYDGFADADFLKAARGDRTRPRSYRPRARRDGVPVNRHGIYTGDTVLLMVGADSEPGRSVARSVKRQVQQLGFRVRLRLTSTDRMYERWCGVRSAKVAICPNVGWFFDFMDPQSLLKPTFHGKAIDDGNNWSLLDKPRINRAINRAVLVPPGAARWKAWAAVNHDITRQAPGVPYLWDTEYQAESDDVNGVINPYTSRWDLSFTSLRE